MKKILALLLAACVFCTVGIFAATAAETDDAGEEVGADVGITVHYNVSGGNMAFTRRYTANGVDSLACVAISGGATFTGLPDGLYIDAVTGDRQTVSGGRLSVPSIGKGNMRVYVCCAGGFKGISGKIGENGTYLK